MLAAPLLGLLLGALAQEFDDGRRLSAATLAAPLLGLLLGALAQERNDGRRFPWLPAPAPLLLILRPLVLVVPDSAGVGGFAQQLERAADDGELLVALPGAAEGVAVGELDAQRAGRSQLLRPIGHHGDEDGADPGRFDDTCQHGHVASAVRSGGGEERDVHLLLDHPLGHLRAIALPPLRVVLLIAHE